MAKKEKKQITAFQQALQQNIQQAVGGEDSASVQRHTNVELRQAVWQRFARMAQRRGVPPEQLAEVALEHFVRMEEQWFTE